MQGLTRLSSASLSLLGSRWTSATPRRPAGASSLSSPATTVQTSLQGAKGIKKDKNFVCLSVCLPHTHSFVCLMKCFSNELCYTSGCFLLHCFTFWKFLHKKLHYTFYRLGEFKKHLVLHEGEEKEQNNVSDVDSDDTEEEEEEEERLPNLKKNRGPGSDGNYSDNSESGNEGDVENRKAKDKHTLDENTSEILVLKTVPKKPPGPPSQTPKIPPGPPGPPLAASAPAAQNRPPPGPPVATPATLPIPRKAISSSSHSAKQGSWYDCCTARLSTHPDFEKPFSRALQERLLATLDTPTVALPG